MGRLETGPLGRGGGNWLGIELRKRQPEEIGLLSSNVSREATHATAFESSLTPSRHPWPRGGKEPSWFPSNPIPVWNLFQSAASQKLLTSDGTSRQGRLEGQEAMAGFLLLVWQSRQDQHKAKPLVQATVMLQRQSREKVPALVAATGKRRCPREALSHPAAKGAMRKESSCSM